MPTDRSRLVAPSEPLSALLTIFQRWLWLPDLMPLLATLATVAANRMDGDPVWLLLIGPPGSGKSEQIQSLSRLADTHQAATLTEAALLSGTPKRERATGAKGGLLRVIGDRGIIVCKDFGSVLSMNRDARASVLAALREVYDGSWTRRLGTDGGTELAWSGHVGLIGGCPPMIDSHHAVMASLGERFLLLRMREESGLECARRALKHAGAKAVAMRRELALSVEAFFSALTLPSEMVELTDDECDALVRLACLVSRCRSAVERDGYSRDIQLIPGAESPNRLTVTLKRLYDGLRVIGVDNGTAWSVVRRVALDSMPVLRRRALELFCQNPERTTAGVAQALRHPRMTTMRVLEDLEAYNLLEHFGDGKNAVWRLDPSAGEDLATLPEMLGSPVTGDPVGHSWLPINRSDSRHSLPVPMFDDISGTVSPTVSNPHGGPNNG